MEPVLAIKRSLGNESSITRSEFPSGVPPWAIFTICKLPEGLTVPIPISPSEATNILDVASKAVEELPITT